LCVDGEQLLEQFVAHGDARDGVAGVGDKPGGKLEPVVAQRAHGTAGPIVSEVVVLQELDEGEGEDADGEVEGIGVELSTGEMVQIVVVV